MTPTRETWLPVVGYEGLYEVSDLGRVRSLDRARTNRSGGRGHRGRVLKQVVQSDRRHRVSLCADGVQRGWFVHHLVLNAFTGSRPEGTEACHNDGDCTNNRPLNLRWDTHANNERDKIRHGAHHQTQKECCPRRHRLAAPNLSRAKAARGHRNCLACERASAMVKYAKRTGRPHDMVAWADDHYARIMEQAAA